jgi:glucokinase
MIVLVDIGGTHARFACLEDGEIQRPEKMPCVEFPDFEQALKTYLGAEFKADITVHMAMAALEQKPGIYHFTNQNKWIVNLKELKNAGIHTGLCMNDFVASAMGAVTNIEQSCTLLKAGNAQSQQPSVILGPGTGLGLAYAFPQKERWFVQKTHGGHMLAAGLTDMHHIIMKIVARLNGHERMIVPEDLASGRAVPVLYKAVCLHAGQEVRFLSVEQLLENIQDPYVAKTWELFHEFLGLFAHNSILTCNAFGGLFLDGGLFSTLYNQGLFDLDRFLYHMKLSPVDLLKEELENLPIYAVNDPYIALRGLKEFAAHA